MSWDADDYREYRQQKQRKNAQARGEATREILEFVSIHSEIAVRELNGGTQFRLTDGEMRIDLYPTHRRYHNIVTGERGGFSSIQKLWDEQRGKKKPELPPPPSSPPSEEDGDPPW